MTSPFERGPHGIPFGNKGLKFLGIEQPTLYTTSCMMSLQAYDSWANCLVLLPNRSTSVEYMRSYHSGRFAYFFHRRMMLA